VSPGPTRRGLGWTGPGATFVLVLLCAVLSLVLAAGLWWRQEADAGVAAQPSVARPITSPEAAREGRTAAAPLVERVLSYTWRDFDDRVERTGSVLGPTYRRQYVEEMAALREQVVDGRVTVEARVSDVGVVSASRERVVALVFVDRVSTAEGSPARRADQVRVLATVAPTASGWRVALLDSF
jgi:Mce-associated membrane protein